MPSSSSKKPSSKNWGVIRPGLPWHKPVVRLGDGDLVILIHGLWRSLWAMDPMAEFLHNKGDFHTINIPYPSYRKSIQSHTKHIRRVIQQHDKGGRIHFVTHSLGGIIARHLLNELTPKQTGHTVMLAPPNKGSEIIAWLDKWGPLKHALGPSGQQLRMDAVDAPPLPPHAHTAVIMGDQSHLPFFRHLLDKQNDGIVSVESGKIDGAHEFHIIPADHTFIATNPLAQSMTLEFLQKGRISTTQAP
jgi:pimeloyl-ACP methyl ester carboxylesterase